MIFSYIRHHFKAILAQFLKAIRGEILHKKKILYTRCSFSPHTKSHLEKKNPKAYLELAIHF